MVATQYFRLGLIAFLLAAIPGGGAARAQTSPADFIALVGRADAASDAKDWRPAMTLWRSVIAANPYEGRFWSRLAAAAYAAKDYDAAIAAWTKTIELGADVPENDAYNIACSYALKGDRTNALAWLRRTIAMGYLDLKGIATDPDLALLRGSPELAAMIPIPANIGKLSRVEGWRADGRFLLWQADRLGAAPYRLHPRTWFVAQLEALAASANRRSDIQLAIGMSEIIRGFGDGHSALWFGRSPGWAATMPLQFMPFADGIYVTAADPAHRDLLGARVDAVGGHPIDAVIAALARGMSRDNEGPWAGLQATLRLRSPAMLKALGMGTSDDQADLTLTMPDGTRRMVAVRADTTNPNIWNKIPAPAGWVRYMETLGGALPLYQRNVDRHYWFEYLADRRTVYFAFNSVRNIKGDESFAAFAERLTGFMQSHPVDRLVIDFRWNNGGNTQLLTPLIEMILRSPQVNRRGHLFAIIGRRTFSAAQNATTLLDRFTKVTFVGEPTGSSPNFVGEEDEFELPYSKLTVNVSTLAWQSGYPQDRRTWIAPLLYVPPRFSDYRVGRDAALEAILSLPPDTMDPVLTSK